MHRFARARCSSVPTISTVSVPISSRQPVVFCSRRFVLLFYCTQVLGNLETACEAALAALTPQRRLEEEEVLRSEDPVKGRFIF